MDAGFVIGRGDRPGVRSQGENPPLEKKGRT